MAHPISALRGMPYLVGAMVTVGAILGGAVVPAVQGFFEVYDQANPVVTMRAEVLKSHDADEVLIRLSGTKERDCQYVGMQAYTRRAGDEAMIDAYIQRIDTPETGVTRPRGAFANFGTWRIWPKGKATSVLVYVQHACSGRLVVGKVAEFTIQGAAS